MSNLKGNEGGNSKKILKEIQESKFKAVKENPSLKSSASRKETVKPISKEVRRRLQQREENTILKDEKAQASLYDESAIRHKKLSEDEIADIATRFGLADKEINEEIRRTIPVNKKTEYKLNRLKKQRTHSEFSREFRAKYEAKVEEEKSETVQKTIRESIEQGLRNESTPVYESIKNKAKLKDKSIYEQLYSHEEGLKYEEKAKRYEAKAERKTKEADKVHEKIKSKTKTRLGKHEKNVVDEKTGQNYSKLKHGFYKEEVKLKQGERTLGQKLQYQSFHQSKQALKRDFEETEDMEGNEGVQVAHSTETVLKDKIVKPFIRDNFGYDRHHVREKKLRSKAKISKAKEEVNKELSESLLESNPISRTIQKRNIKKRIYKEQGLYKSPVQKVKDFIGGVYRVANPFQKIKEAWHAVSTAFSAMGLLIQSILNSSVFIIVILIPIIAFVSIFSIFFGFGESPDVEIASMSRYWNEQITDIRMELIEADELEYYEKSLYDPVDEVRIAGGVDIDVALEKIRQVQVIGYISAILQDELSKSEGEALLKTAFDELYQVNQEHVDEGWWEEQIVGYEPYYPVLDSEGNISHYEGGEPIYEDVWVEYWVLYLSLEQGDINEYALNEFDQLDEEAKELALLQYEQYQEGLGYGQIGRNPFDESFDWRNYVSSLYGYRIMNNEKELHNGLDIAVPVGTPLYAIADGEVTAVGSSSTEGNYVYYEIDSAGTKYTVKYLHLDSVNVRRGETIVEGQLLALSGNTGRSTGAHLHLQIEQGGKKTNPLFLVEFPQ